MSDTLEEPAGDLSENIRNAVVLVSGIGLGELVVAEILRERRRS